MAVFCKLVILEILFYCCYGQSTINATSTTATSETYQVSGSSPFKNGKIQCNLEECFIFCDNGFLACDGLAIDASISNKLQLQCEQNVCRNILVENGAKNDNDVSCVGSTSCQDGSFTFQNVINSVNITCKDFSCSGAIWQLYNIQSVNIKSQQGALGNVMLNDTQFIDITCNTSSSCSDFYLDGINEFQLDSYGANPLSNGNIYGQNVAKNGKLEINCNDADSCRNLNLYVPQEEMVTVNCNSDDSCPSLNVYIPSIFYDELSLNCAADTSQTSCNTVKFWCVDTTKPLTAYKLYAATINYNSTMNKYICDDDDAGNTGCCPLKYRDLGNYYDIASTASNMTFNCDVTVNDCKSAIINLTQFDGDATIHCTSDYSCKDVIIYGIGQKTDSYSSQLTVICNGVEACKRSYIEGKYTMNTTIICSGNEACFRQRVLYPDTMYNSNGQQLLGRYDCSKGINVCKYAQFNANGINMTVDCTGIDSASYSSSKCEQLYGAVVNSQIDINCDSKYDCFNSIWSLTDDTTATYSCSASNGCYQMHVFGYNAKALDFQCTASASCQYSSFRCPSTTEQSCNFNCDGAYACNNIDIYSSENWILQHLDIQCISGSAVCSGPIEIHCPFDTGSTTINWGYNSNCDNGGYCCQSQINQDKNNYIDCCPFGTEAPTAVTSSPTFTPTKDTNDPTVSPSYNPSSSPSQSPTGVTNKPTSSPSSNPSITPTKMPSNTPITMPSNAPNEPNIVGAASNLNRKTFVVPIIMILCLFF